MPDGTGPTLRIDGELPLSAELVARVGACCDQAEDLGESGLLRVVVSGVPEPGWSRGLDVALVSKWERALRRLERLPVATLAVAVGDCGGTALEALLATDYRIAAADVRLVLPAEDGAVWPGMLLYRLVQQAGVARVRRAVLFGAAIEADEALDMRLLDELVADPMAALAASPSAVVGGCPRPDLAVRRRLAFDAPSTTFENALGVHLAACDRVLRRSPSEVIA
ncbi:enoyl-CoA hydratase/isomerase family protein [Micromonospora sp. HM5-17]|nr:enoyl-CoA hydratase/isomerase family protein [Micromonospora sp. HM5-17]